MIKDRALLDIVKEKNKAGKEFAHRVQIKIIKKEPLTAWDVVMLTYYGYQLDYTEYYPPVKGEHIAGFIVIKKKRK